MLPYLTAPVIRIGGLVFDPTAIPAGVGVMVGHFAFLRSAQARGFDRIQVSRLSLYFMIAGSIGAVLFGLVANSRTLASLSEWRTNPPSISSFGAIAGAILVALVWARVLKLTFESILRLLDAATLAFPPTWLFLRLGCILQHDHAGIRSSNWLAVPYPDWPRYDLAFLEFLFMLPVWIGFTLLRRRPLPAGSFILLMSVLYSGLRLTLDPLRVDPIHYWGGSMDQWTAAGLACFGLFILSRMQFHRQGQGAQ